jgi:site-specific recombinase XerD
VIAGPRERGVSLAYTLAARANLPRSVFSTRDSAPFLLILRNRRNTTCPLESGPSGWTLFQTTRHSHFTTRRVQQIVKVYAERAGVKATPHTFRHQAITWLTRHSGLADAELQLITGHAKRETLAIYQHVALDGDLEAKYQATMKDVAL